MQRLKADAEIALLKKTEEANREHRVLVGRESNASDEVELLNTARGEEERRSLRTKILELNQVCEEQESKLQSDMNDRLKLEHEVKQLKSVANFGQLVPALPLICHELYMSAREMSFLHALDADPPEKLAFNADPATEYTHSGSRLCNSTRTRCCALTRKRARSRTW
jgi:hypothetical protein